MNFRFLLFAFLMMISMMVMNYWFGSSQPSTTSSTPIPAKQTEFDWKPISLEQLPLSSLYEKVDAREPLLSVFTTSPGNYLTVAIQKQMPKHGYTQTTKGTLTRVTQMVDSSEIGDLVFYSDASSPILEIASLPEIGTQRVEVFFPLARNKGKILPGQYENGQILLDATAVDQNGIVLYKQNGRYLPCGLYRYQDGQFTPFSALSSYEKWIDYPMEKQGKPHEEQFYVLESPTMQVVFSTTGGAIAEVNLPFKSSHSPDAVVLPTGLDRQIAKSSKENVLFPLRPYWKFDPQERKPLKSEPTQGGYYPLLRRGVLSKNPSSSHPLPPAYYAFNTLSENPEFANHQYKVTHFDGESIRFELSLPERRMIKTYHLSKDHAPYVLSATIQVDGDARGLWINSGVPEVELISGSPAPSLQYSRTQNGNFSVSKISLPKTSNFLDAIEPNWISNSNGYFSLLFDPLTRIGTGIEAALVPGNLVPTRLSLIHPQAPLYPANKYPGYQLLLPLKTTNTPAHFRLFLGPLDQAILKEVDTIYTDAITGYSPKYIKARTFHGYFSFISEPFAKFLFLIMQFFHHLTSSWGLSIILLTVVLRIMMYPLNAWSIRSTMKMQEISPKLQKLQAKYKNDPKKAQLEMMQFYKEHKINPFGGCLPLIIQMPFLFGMFDLLKSTFALRGAVFIPGWIDNLTAPDHLFSWSTPIPFIGNSFHLLPILLGVVMFFQQKFTTAQNKKTGVVLTDQQKQQQKMGTIMTVAFTVLFYKFPSGLNLYWFSSMGLQILQQWYMMKKNQKKKQSSTEIVVTPRSK